MLGHLAIRRFTLLVTLLTVLIGGCATSTQRTDSHPVWPSGGNRPRIVHRQNIDSPRDLGDPNAWQWFGQLFAGKVRQPLLRPQAVALGNGHLFVADPKRQMVHVLRPGTAHHRALRRIGDDHLVSPVGLAYCENGIVVSDSVLKRVALLDMKGRLLRAFAPPEGFKRPTGLAYDPQRKRLYVVDTGAHEICVFRPDGTLIERIGGPGAHAAEFNYPTYICVDRQGWLYVIDSLNFRVQCFDPAGRFLFELGELGNASGYLAVPKGVGVDSYGHIYVVDSYFSAVQIFDDEGRLLLSFGTPGEGAGQFHVPAGLTISEQNQIYICDSHNGRVQVFEYIGGPEHDSAR